MIRVVAAENFWGSIARQVGGTHVQVVSIITNPNTDPHSYEPTAGDAREIAGAQFVIENGIGYDPWVSPHLWYNPADVQEVIRRIVSDYQALDPADSTYFNEQETSFDTVALKRYHATIAAIKAQYSGTPVGASESIFAMLAPALGLNLVTPYAFLKAISEGTDVSAGDKEIIDNQIKNHLIEVYVYNVTPDVQAQLAEVRAEHIPYATITETLAPASSTYQAWQTKQLLGIEAALAEARRRS